MILEGPKKSEERPNEDCEWFAGEHDMEAHVVHKTLPYTTTAGASARRSGRLIEYVLHIDAGRLVVLYKVESVVEDDEEVRFEVVA